MKIPCPDGCGLEVETLDYHEVEKLKKSHEALLEFAKKHHEVCEDCEGTGKIYNNADPTSGQWVPCPYAEAIAEAGE